MKTSLALSWKALVSKIHPPLPISPRDSQQLLGSLNASFQRHLDAEHPAGPEAKSHHAHMQSILGSPIFGSNTSRRPDSAVKILREKDMSLSGVQLWMNEPLQAFQTGVSNGTATLETAKLCLQIKLKDSLDSSLSSKETTMESTGTGSAVLNWLWSSGIEQSGAYLKDLPFMRLITITLAIEQRYDIVYNWFLRLQDPGTAIGDMDHKQRQMAQTHVLLQLIKSEAEHGAGLGAAMVHFVQYFDRIPKEHLHERARIFRPAGSFLSFSLADPGNAETIPNKILSPFIDTTKGWAKHTSLIRAIQHVFDPENPRADVALRFLQDTSPERLDNLSIAAKYRLIHMCLKATQLLVASGQHSDATRIIDYIQTNFAEQVGSKAVGSKAVGIKVTDKQQELNNLELLESLAVS